MSKWNQCLCCFINITEHTLSRPDARCSSSVCSDIIPVPYETQHQMTHSPLFTFALLFVTYVGRSRSSLIGTSTWRRHDVHDRYNTATLPIGSLRAKIAKPENPMKIRHFWKMTQIPGGIIFFDFVTLFKTTYTPESFLMAYMCCHLYKNVARLAGGLQRWDICSRETIFDLLFSMQIYFFPLSIKWYFCVIIIIDNI